MPSVFHTFETSLNRAPGHSQNDEVKTIKVELLEQVPLALVGSPLYARGCANHSRHGDEFYDGWWASNPELERYHGLAELVRMIEQKGKGQKSGWRLGAEAFITFFQISMSNLKRSFQNSWRPNWSDHLG